MLSRIENVEAKIVNKVALSADRFNYQINLFGRNNFLDILIGFSS